MIHFGLRTIFFSTGSCYDRQRPVKSSSKSSWKWLNLAKTCARYLGRVYCWLELVLQFITKFFFITKFLWKSEGVDAWGFSNDDKWWSDDTLVSMIQNLLVKSEEKGEQKFCTGDVFSLKNILKMGDINVL